MGDFCGPNGENFWVDVLNQDSKSYQIELTPSSSRRSHEGESISCLDKLWFTFIEGVEEDEICIGDHCLVKIVAEEDHHQQQDSQAGVPPDCPDEPSQRAQQSSQAQTAPLGLRNLLLLIHLIHQLFDSQLNNVLQIYKSSLLFGGRRLGVLNITADFNHMQQQLPRLAAPHSSLIAVKEQLDLRHLHGNVSQESAPLLLKLLDMISNLEQQGEAKNGDSTLEHTRSEQEEALALQVRSLTKENNQIRNQVLSLKDEIDLQKLKMQDLCGQALTRNNEQASLTLLTRNYQLREDDLREELAQVIFKYNELMDLIHEDPHQERQYIKRLLKHNRIAPLVSRPDPPLTQIAIQTSSERQMAVRISLLEAQLLSRNAEIKRLQLTLVDDCVEIACKKWKSHSQNWQVQQLREELAALRAENEDLTKLATTKPDLIIVDKQRGKQSINSKGRSTSTDKKLKTLDLGREKKRTMESEHLSTRKTVASGNRTSVKQVQKQSSEYYTGQVFPSDPYNLAKFKEIPSSQSGKHIKTKNQMQSSSKDDIPIVMQNAKIKHQLKKNRQVAQEAKKSDLRISSNIKHQGLDHKLPSPQFKHYLTPSSQTTKPYSPRTGTDQPRISSKNHQSSSSLSSQERNRLMRELQQRQARITQLQELLEHSQKREAKVINKTRNIHSQKSQTNNLIINQNKNQYINISPLRKRQVSESLNKRLRELEAELYQVMQERDDLRRRQNETGGGDGRGTTGGDAKKAGDGKEQRQHLQEEARHQKERRKELEQKMKQMQEKLIFVNKENISLQAQLNDSLELIKTIQRKESQGQAQRFQDIPLDHDELERLRREVQRLSRELSVLKAEREVLSKQLRQTEGQLQNQSRQMIRFERSIGKQYREASLSP